ncbi:MAG: RluA family pseudouridine synthase [Treponema sp.]|nr:RluA family pseudouridine synthase [Treponema sp.]
MFPPFPQERAQKLCLSMIRQLEEGALVLQQVTQLSEERAGIGIMLGALICTDADGNEITLKTASGFSRALSPQFEDDAIYVPPVITPDQIERAIAANDDAIHALTARIDALAQQNSGAPADEAQKKSLIEERLTLTQESVAKVYALYSFHCADGSTRSLFDICAERCGGKYPPTGTGDCCAPKLLDYAFSHGLTPVSMCEVFYGRGTPHKKSGTVYPPCDDRCGIILPAMLGLDILYRDNDIIVVNKQSGILSVPGKTEKDCIVNRVRRLFPQCIEQPAVHRLDMETSGLLVLAFTKEAHRNLNKQFEAGTVQKEYVALVDGVLPAKKIPAHGTMELYFRVDLDNRPHQMWDEVHGKKAVTEWQIQDVETYYAPDGSRRKVTRVHFIPHTGRTHQLRLASADSHGFGVPIIGDTLYGHCEQGERLMLHAQYLSFTHPTTGERMEFRSKADF